MNSGEQRGPDFGMGEKTFPVYIAGFIFCVILTLIPFELVQQQVGSKSIQYAGIFICAILQFLVQVICFLRMNGRTAQAKINLMSFIFSIVVLAIIVGGSLWIMWHLNYNMMH